MDIEATLRIIEALADGADPDTGRSLPADHLCHRPGVVRALCRARTLIEREARRERRLGRARLMLPANTGKAWSLEEDRALIARLKTGTSIADMAILHARTQGAITARLEKLGQLSHAPSLQSAA